MQLKDLRIIMETAQEYGMPLPTTAENAKLYESMIEMGMGELDNSAVLGVLEQMAGVGLLI
jgi:2-hydroxy-3-oxopropionate reductase